MSIGIGIGAGFQNKGGNSLPQKVVIVSDAFNRADGPIGTADTGQIWENIENSMVITGNNVNGSAAAVNNTAVIESGKSDAEISSTVIGTSADWKRIVFRAIDANNYFYFQTRATGAGQPVQLFRKQAGASTSLFAVTGTVAAGSKMKVILLGSKIRCFIDATEYQTATDTFNQTATKHGIGSNNTVPEFDDFKVMA